MRRLTSKRLLQAASLLLAAITALFAVLWAVRGIRPAIACGLMAALARGDWSAAYACINLAEYDALIAIVALAGSVLTWIASRKASDRPIGEYSPTPAEHARNRGVMLDRVHAIWIDGWLDQTLYQTVLMHLGMTWRAAVPRPGGLLRRRPGEQERPVPADVPYIRLFDEAEHILLILGEPGSGKTTMMLDLARTLLEQARTDAAVPISVVFNLSSFTEAERSLADWLVSEFRRGYDVPEKLARYWLAHNELALLLDGLDEVRADRRADVVAKINHYRSEHLAPWLVICCRKDEYAQLSAADSALADVDAVVLQPLTSDQVDGYLAGLDGPEPRQLWRALQGDPALLEVAGTPLMLNVMLLAAGALNWDDLPSPHSPAAVRSHIYDAYLHSMLERPRNTGPHYPQTKTLHWLNWLSRKMLAHGQTVFLLERMNRSWFNRPRQRYFSILVGGLIFGLVFGLILGLSVGLLFGLLFGLLSGLTVGLTVGLYIELGDIEVKERFRFKVDRGGLIVGPRFEPGDFKVKERIRFKVHRDGLTNALFFGLSGGLIFGLIGGLRSGLIAGLSSGLMLGLRDGLIDRSTGLEENYRRSRPNAAIRRSLLSGLTVGLIGGLILGLINALLSGLSAGLIVGPFFGLLVGLLFGLAEVIKHYILRLALFFDGSMPLNYVRFLDYCADRILLRRVGGGYIFIHRTFMEHVAGLDLDAPQWRSGS